MSAWICWLIRPSVIPLRDTHFLVLNSGVVVLDRATTRACGSVPNIGSTQSISSPAAPPGEYRNRPATPRARLEDERRARIVALLCVDSMTSGQTPSALNPHRQCLGRSIVTTPQATVLASQKLRVVFADLGIPGARAVFAAAGPRSQYRGRSDDTLYANRTVAADIHPACRLTHPAIERIHHLQ